MPLTPLRRIRRIQKIALTFLVLSGVINYIDRATLAVGLPLIRRDLGISLAQSGFLLSAFLWAYAISQLPSGGIADRFGARRVLSAGLGLWSLAEMLGGIVATFWQFIGVRALLGIGESGQFPTCARVVADWFGKRDRGLATGIWNCSSSLGTAIATPLLTGLMILLGWRRMFITMGLAGLVVAVAIYCFHRDPGQITFSAAELEYLCDPEREQHPMALRDWRRLFGFSTTWGMVLGFIGVVYMSWLFYAWLPQYLEIQWHLSIAKTGWVAAIPFVCGVFGSVAGGRLCDTLFRRGLSNINSCKLPFVVSLLGAAICTALAAYTSRGLFAVGYISLSLLMINSASSAAWAMATVAAPQNYAASLGSIQNFGGYFGGAMAPIVTGYMVQLTGSFRSALLVASVVALFASAGHLLFVRKPISLAGNRTI